mgnify:FL=1
MPKSLSFYSIYDIFICSEIIFENIIFYCKIITKLLFNYNIRAFFHLKKPDFLRSFRPKQITMHTDHAALYFTQLHW